MHLVTALSMGQRCPKAVQPEDPNPPTTFPDFLPRTDFQNRKTFYIGTSPSVSFCDISIKIYQGEPFLPETSLHNSDIEFP